MNIVNYIRRVTGRGPYIPKRYRVCLYFNTLHLYDFHAHENFFLKFITPIIAYVKYRVIIFTYHKLQA